MNGVQLAAALREGRRVYGTAILSTSPVWPAMIARTGADFVFIDTEHIPIPRDTLTWMCRSFSALGIVPIVRTPAPDPYQACMALDSGAVGVVAPYLESVDQVIELRGAAKFRPLKGQRLERALAGEESLEPALVSFLREHNQDRLLIVNIESIAGIEALDDILKVPDLAAILVGPHDLSINMGLPEQYEHPDYNAAVRTIIQKSRAAGVGVGVHFSEGIERELVWAKEGANLIVHASDMALVEQGLRRDFERFRRELGDPGAPRRQGPPTPSAPDVV